MPAQWAEPSSDPKAAPDLLAAPSPRVGPLIAAGAVFSGFLLGLFEIANTSIGWHLAGGRWILAERAVPWVDPFSLTCGGRPWLDHEWLFQAVAALIDAAAGPAGLVLLRALAMAALTLLLVAVGVRSGLAAPAALLLAALCVAGARPRFFVRPEMVTLLVVPACVWLYLSRDRRPRWLTLLGVAALMVVGANAHGAAVIVPFLVAGLLAAELAQSLGTRSGARTNLLSGAAVVAVSFAAGLANPYGWQLYAAPFRLAALVGDPAVQNPEWFPPTPDRVPALFVALAAGLVILGLKERRLVHWALFLMAAVLALRYLRNLGLFFVLLPLALAPALASWRSLAAAEGPTAAGRRSELLAVAAALVLALSMAVAPQPGFGFGYDQTFYPTAACDFLDREGLPRNELYNDVRFGGYLIDRYWPERRVFQDDRNEVHEPLLREIWAIFRSSDAPAFTALLERYQCDTALVRYHPPLRLQTPDGTTVGERGFSSLWLPADEWALVYWDDLAMVFVRRREASPELLERCEYRVIRPDDMAGLEQRLAGDPTARPQAATEALRALDANPDSLRARRILELIQGPSKRS